MESYKKYSYAAGVALVFSIAVSAYFAIPDKAPPPSMFVPPYKNFLSSYGLIIPESELVNIGSDRSGIVRQVFVMPGDSIKKGTPLFQLNDEELQSDKKILESKRLIAKEKLERLKKMPDPRELPILQATLDDLKADYKEASARLNNLSLVKDKSIVSQEEVLNRETRLMKFKALVEKAEAELNKASTGTWEPDLIIAETEVREMEAEIALKNTQLEKMTIRSPLDGEVMQVNIHAGEFVKPEQNHLMIVGSKEKIVKVDLNEYDISYLRNGMYATGYPKGDDQNPIQLELVRIEPYVRPLEIYVDDTAQRKDTRILRMIYKVTGSKKPVYSGQQIDVYIKNDETTSIS